MGPSSASEKNERSRVMMMTRSSAKVPRVGLECSGICCGGALLQYDGDLPTIGNSDP